MFGKRTVTYLGPTQSQMVQLAMEEKLDVTVWNRVIGTGSHSQLLCTPQ